MDPLLPSTSSLEHSAGQALLRSLLKMQSSGESTSTVLKHDEYLWFEDGSVVLETEGIFFKVYSGILAQSSSVFKDMFSFPQPSPDDSSAETYDGCPLVHMLDSAHDLRHFLRALNDSRYGTN